jgi:mannose-6-phosphate isomerase-like protein (cupin superfamily)
MIKVKDGQGTPYEVPGHLNVYGIKKITGEQAKHFICSYSCFQPNGGAVMEKVALERIYYVVSGTLTCNGKNGEKHDLGPGDILYIGAGEERDMVITGGKPAEVLVIIATKD